MLIPILTFLPFHLDPTNACLWRGNTQLPLMPKDFAVLHYLAAQAGQLVTKEELLSVVWGKTRVSTGVLKNGVERIRRALGDSATQPRFIETVHGRGYRFIAAVTAAPVSSFEFRVPSLETQSSVLSPQHSALVGRETELTQLHRWLDKAHNGERQLVFVTGEPGIGKTTLVESFPYGLAPREQEESQKSKVKAQKSKVSEAQSSALSPQSLPSPSPQHLAPSPWLARGQCIKQYGAGEPYLPVLDALGRMCRGPMGASLIPILRQHAPMWLLQMPALLSESEFEALQRRTVGATQERMLREIAEGLEVLTADQPLVLVLEDLHWADASTVELLSLLARRPDPTRLLVIGTYRPMAVLRNGQLNGVTHELYAHNLCSELALQLLSEEDVAVYLRQRFPRGVFPTRLAEVLHRRTEGNPFFLVSVIDDLVAQGMIVQVEENWVLQSSVESLATGVPENVRHLVARQRERLEPAEQQVLEAASVAGMEFSVAAVAAALETEVVAVGERCARLGERRQFLRPAGIAEWPDGTVAARYGFVHALYQHLWYERVSIEKQQQWHLRVGARKETAYGNRASEIAAELAMHFERGQDYRRAVQYLGQATQNALRRSANREAIDHLTRGLDLLKTLPDTPERAQQELALQVALRAPLMMMRGYGAPDVERVLGRVQELCAQASATPPLIPALHGMRTFRMMQGHLPQARALSEQMLELAKQAGHAEAAALLPRGHAVMGEIAFHQGEFPTALEHAEHGIALYSPDLHRAGSFLFLDLGVTCLGYAALTLWYLGYPEQALKRSHEAVTLARELAHPYSLEFALCIAAWLRGYRREWLASQEQAEAAVAVSREHGFPSWLALGMMYRGRALIGQGHNEAGIAQIEGGLSGWRATGVQLVQPMFLGRQAEGYGNAGQPERGLPQLTEALALVARTEERRYEAELHRLKGQLTLQKFHVSSFKFQVSS